MLVDESEKDYQVIIPLPGIKKDDIKIQALNREIIVKFKGNQLIDDGEITVKSDFDIDITKVKPLLEDGVLVIEIGKPEPVTIKW